MAWLGSALGFGVWAGALGLLGTEEGGSTVCHLDSCYTGFTVTEGLCS